MYNGIGLTTPRGSGTNGYVMRNLSTLRVHETAADRAAAWDVAPPKHREPDEAILEHERKRKVEIKCLELQLQLEDDGLDEATITTRVEELRTTLNKDLASLAPSVKKLKPSDTHGIAAAKKAELDKMARALGTRSNYTEGEAFDREKQEENKMRRMVEREERDRKREEERSKVMEQKQKWEAERRERDRLRRREEDRIRKEREETSRRKERMPPPPVPAFRDRPRDYRGERDRRSRSPRRERDVRRRRSPSRSPPPRRRSPSPVQSKLRSRSPERTGYRRSGSITPPSRRSPPSIIPNRLREHSESPPRRGHERSKSPPRRGRDRSESPPRRRGRDRSDSPPRQVRELSPPPRNGPEQDRGRNVSRSPRPIGRGRSASSDSSMSLPTSPSTRYLKPTYDFSAHTQSSATKSTIALGDEYLLPVYARPPFVLSHGRGSWVWDAEGRKFLDFSAGIAVNALGHADPGVSEVLQQQSSTLLHTSNVYYNKWAPKLAELLVTLTQKEGGLGYATSPSSSTAKNGAKVFFANSGTEANEGALKIARKVGKDRWAATTGGKADDPSCPKTHIVCFENSFHGRSMGALSVTSTEKYQLPFRPLIPGVSTGKLNDLDCLDRLITDDTCVVIVEPIQGEGGATAATEKWLRALRKRCDETGTVLIYDEIQCGLYRTGNLWAHSALPIDCHPDIITMAKPLANGYPIGAVLLRDSVASTMTAGTHGTTFGGSPTACAVGHHVLNRLSDRAFVAHMKEISAHMNSRLELLPEWFPAMLQPHVRGRGFIRGLGFIDASHPGEVVQLARERGVFLLTAGKDAVRFVPSLNVTKEEVDVAMDVLEGCLSSLRG
ncbi:pyridoxal phosphate-dependent transferase [Suillus paluster]|uniref:pyridoxal phosphate-dependent transferase n=1 Tax=Suillus paluster TaxID=48578 RepID=UPI001B8739B5|nr:pyridoxal phosphate-dependent transferase [Suillus paluster]KAG1753777.1 pyridoxal phosphate-dependent transferase [Suillus paluster]